MTDWGPVHPEDAPGGYGRHVRHDGGDDLDDRRAWPLIVFTAVLILAVTAASSTLLASDDTVDPTETVTLEPVGHVQEDDFFGDLDVATAEDSGRSLTEIAERVATLETLANATVTTTASLSGLQVTGTEPGLYAGNRGESVCDMDALRDALTGAEGSEENDSGDGVGSAEASRADAWAQAVGLGSTDEIPELLDSLTAVRLRLDTRVTNYTFRAGQAVPFQSVLQAGTAVLVDDTGAPRVKCNCGNPLGEPSPLGAIQESQALDVDRMAANPDLAWDRLDPQRVATVTPGQEPLEAFLMAEIDTAEPLERPRGTNGGRDMGKGDFQATLRWEAPSDLDLSVNDPNDATISAESPSPENSRGRLDQDANRQCEENMAGTETVSWPDGDAPPGEYTVTVTGHAVGDAYEADCGDSSVEFTLTIRVFGQDAIVHGDSVSDSEAKEYKVTLD